MVLILNDVSGSEIMLILFFVLIFFGAKSIPNLARTMGRTIRQIKDASAEIQSEIKKSGDEMKKDLNLKQLMNETAEDIQRPLDQYAQDLENAVKYAPPKNSHLNAAPMPQVNEQHFTEVAKGTDQVENADAEEKDIPKKDQDPKES